MICRSCGHRIGFPHFQPEHSGMAGGQLGHQSPADTAPSECRIDSQIQQLGFRPPPGAAPRRIPPPARPHTATVRSYFRYSGTSHWDGLRRCRLNFGDDGQIALARRAARQCSNRTSPPGADASPGTHRHALDRGTIPHLHAGARRDPAECGHAEQAAALDHLPARLGHR